MKKLTIFTPIYNRAHLIRRLYNSIIKQKEINNITWLVIDDGSTDNISDVMNRLINEKLLDIVFISNQENIGKMRTFNKAIEIADSVFFECVDSDDYLLDSYSDYINQLVRIENKNKNDHVIGYVAKRLINGKENRELPKLKSTKFNDIYDVYHYDTDLQVTFKLNQLKEFRFDFFGEEPFVTEMLFYSKIDLKYDYIPIDIFTVKGEYQPDGYTANQKSTIKSSPVGWAACYIDLSRKDKSIKKFSKLLLASSLYWLGSQNARKDMKSTLNLNFFEYVLIFLGYPLSIVRGIKGKIEKV